MFGKFYTFYSIKWIYLFALSIFEIGSLVCATTPTSVGLICGRAIAGLGAAGLFSGSILIIHRSVPLDKRPVYTGLVGSMFGIASVAGPLYVFFASGLKSSADDLTAWEVLSPII
jgi:MFS family permease